MSLLHPTLGEMIERFLLLRLKIRHGEILGKDIAHFEKEKTEIREALRKRDKWPREQLMQDLMQVQAQLWGLIERANNGDEHLRAAFVQKVNRRRIEIREQIDKEAGEFQGEEKL